MAGSTGQAPSSRQILREGRRGQALGALIVLGFASSVGRIRARGQDSPFAITPGQMPVCDSPVSRRGLLTTITDAPGAELVGLIVSRIDTIGELASDPAPTPDWRVCIATVLTNGGRKLVGFTLSWAGEARDDVYLELPFGLD